MNQKTSPHETLVVARLAPKLLAKGAKPGCSEIKSMVDKTSATRTPEKISAALSDERMRAETTAIRP